MAIRDAEGLSLTDALARLAAQGFVGSFAVEEAARVRCLTCQTIRPASGFDLLAHFRTEGQSDPSEMAVIAGLACPTCHAKGTLVLPFGTQSSAREAAVLANLTDVAHARDGV